MQAAAVYAVPTSILFKHWQQEAHHQPPLSHAAPTDGAHLSRKLLLRNPSPDDTQLIFVTYPTTAKFQLDTPTDGSGSSGDVDGASTAGEPIWLPSGGDRSAQHGRFYELPPQATLTCSVLFHTTAATSTTATSAVSSNHQDALFVYTSTCTASPFLTVPLLAIAAGDTAAPSSFLPLQLNMPPSPPQEFFVRWQAAFSRRVDEEAQRMALQQTVCAGGGNQPADVFVLDNEGDEDHMDMSDNESPTGGADDQDEAMRALGERIAREAAAGGASDEEDASMTVSGRQRTPPHPSAATTLCSASTSRSTLTSSAGLYRSGLTARLHSSAGGRSTAGLSAHGAPRPLPGGELPGEQHVYQSFARPATAEQRHLTARLDVGFVARTETAIDEIMREDLEAEEEREEQEVRRTEEAAPIARPGTAAQRYHANAAAAAAAGGVPMIQMNPAAMVMDDATAASGGGGAGNAEQDEADFYQQILLTARGKNSAASPPPSSSSSSVAAASAPRVARVGSGRRAHSGIPRQSPSGSPTPDSSSQQRPSPDVPATGARRSSPREGARGASAGASATTVTGMMRTMQLNQGATPSASSPAAGAGSEREWADRLAREQEVERRKYVQQQLGSATVGPPTGSPMHPRTPGHASGATIADGPRGSASAATGGGLKFPKLK